jgi:hypothetical protein
MVLSQYLASNKLILKYGVCFHFLFNCLFISCNSNVDKDNSIKKNKKIETQHHILKEQSSMLKNKKISSLKTVLGDSLTTTNHVVFLYNGFDCSTCIDIGYIMSKKMDSISKAQLVYVVSTSANIGRDQLKNDYQTYVYNDEKDLIRKDLKYIYTPVFLLLDSNNKISKVFYPNYNRDKNKENLFIKECIENIQ